MKLRSVHLAIGLLALLPFILASCLKSEEEIPDFNTQLQNDIQAIDNYLASNNIIAVEDISGLRYVLHEDTTTHKPTIDSCVTANYRGFFLLALDITAATHIGQVFFHSGALLIGNQLLYILMLRRNYQESSTKEGVDAGGEDFQQKLNTRHMKLQ